MSPFFLFPTFETYLTVEKRYAENTVVAYRKDLSDFFYTMEENGILHPEKITHRNIRSWLVGLVENKLNPLTVNRKISAVRTYFRWALKKQLIQKNPALGVTGPKSRKRLPSFAKESEMSEEKWRHVFSADFDGLRDYAMIEIFYQTGLRLSELINLLDKDVSEHSIRVLGKRGKERLIPISVDLHVLLREYAESRQANSINSPYFFTLNNGSKLYPKFVYRKINRYLGLTTSLDKKSPHVLRHTFATHLLNRGAGLEVIKDLLGHANLTATQVYTHNSFAKLTGIYSHAHPRGAKFT